MQYYNHYSQSERNMLDQSASTDTAFHHGQLMGRDSLPGNFNLINVVSPETISATSMFSYYPYLAPGHPHPGFANTGPGQPMGYHYAQQANFELPIRSHHAGFHSNGANWVPGYPHMPGPRREPVSAGMCKNWHRPVVERTLPDQSFAVPRGPPRKPSRSGHAIWVGNLPPNTCVLRLKDHFSNGCTAEIESVFLMARSNCAFVNYRDEASCTSAQSRFHGSNVDGNLVVCRIRKDAPTKGDVLLTTSPQHPGSLPTSPTSRSVVSTPEVVLPVIVGSSPSPELTPPVAKAKVLEKFIVLKSLTVQDLEASVRQRTWTTQPQNVAILNKAFGEAETLYLIFSANKSGEYFGYARMLCPISDGPVEGSTDTVSPTDKTGNEVHSPRSTPTQATCTAPRGRVVDDLARGILFWEALKSGDIEDQALESEGQSDYHQDTVGKPFDIEWLSTTRLPFHHTRGLRNPWNQNREVKIARDGTEVEPTIGRRLLGLFGGA
ncbi:hypothetical protein LTR37_003482 [Vermiconidia calcicola]|uniref:Uncharacterized protein n=1 Tax=Vermiconidia calcicola TaxID=1690605 RepID=A0ACC3NPJ0_9PEZI|nr:hypothetical protein LTR37_003482 [Vermiconidia calcicola]